jgi:hypothetical protein
MTSPQSRPFSIGPWGSLLQHQKDPGALSVLNISRGRWHLTHLGQKSPFAPHEQMKWMHPCLLECLYDLSVARLALAWRRWNFLFTSW